jgi:phosphoribosylaminoimidazole-succinocarboxamide synthase
MKAGERFTRPFIEFTTKLEDEDRHLHEDEAMKLAGLTHKELQTLKERTVQVAMLLRDILALMNVELWDGKLEWAFQGAARDFQLVDAIGLDELRVSFLGHALSKEFLREHYRKSSWFQALEHSKDWAHLHGGDFKDICLKRFSEMPAPLPNKVKEAAESLYLSFANDLSRVVTGEVPFDEKYQLVWWVKEYT